VIYQDPLAYLLGLEGIALLDAWAGDHDRPFTDARLAEIRRLLDDEKLRDRGVSAERVSTVLAYEQQSAGYDAEAGGGLFAADEPVVAEYLGGREPGVALDAACGTGTRGSVITARGPAGEPCIAATYRHQLGDYLRPALRLGFQVRRCEEPRTVPSASRPLEPAAGIGDWQDWPWSLMDYLPSAALAAGGHPSLVIWHFRLPAS
jgi:hypothetical protein